MKQQFRFHTIELYLFLALLTLPFICYQKAYGQLVVSGGAGITNKYFSAELQAGWRFANSTLTAGYIALPDNSQPALFNIRAGQVINNTVHVYAGYVRVMRSSDNKEMNSNTWQVGAQYLFCRYKNGCFYAGGTYTGNGMVSAHIGMAMNLSKQNL